MTAHPQPVSVALRVFAQDPTRAGKSLRQALETDSESFLKAIISHCGFDMNDRGFRYALVLLCNGDHAIPMIANPASTTPEQAIGLTKCILTLDPNFVNALPDAIFSRAELSHSSCVMRILDIVERYAGSLANWRSITRLYREGEPKVKSRCATLLVRYRFDRHMTAARFDEGDARVRASIVEAMSERTVDPADVTSSRLIETALNDQNNRVAGNACLTLYQAGDSRALACLSEMLNRESPKFRITAAWVMGRTRDMRFAESLTGAACSKLPELRTTAQKSLDLLEPLPAEMSTTETSMQPVAISVPACLDRTELWVRVVDGNSRFVRGLRPIDFFLFFKAIGGSAIGGRYTAAVLDYSVDTRTTVANTSIAIVYPVGCPGLESALADTLRNKPHGQAWAISAYGSTIAPNQQTLLPAYWDESSRIEASLLSGPPGTLSAGRSCRSLLRLPNEAASRHLVVILDGPDAVDVEFERIFALCRERGISWHCWRTDRVEPADPAVAERIPLIELPCISDWWTHFAASLQECYVLRSPVASRPVALILRDSKINPPFTSPAKFFTPHGATA